MQPLNLSLGMPFSLLSGSPGERALGSACITHVRSCIPIRGPATEPTSQTPAIYWIFRPLDGISSQVGAATACDMLHPREMCRYVWNLRNH